MARPALEALAGQQRMISGLQQRIAGLDNTVEQQRSVIAAQHGQILTLARGVQALAEHLGPETVGKVASAMTRTADVQNPAQPVPEPPAEPSPHGTQETKTPQAFADVSAPGLVPGSTQDVAADVTSTVYTPGQDIPAPPVKQLVDVTRPVDGTQGPQPLGDVKTLTDVRVGDPMNPQTGFPLRGDFANAQRTSSLQGGENTGNTVVVAAIRLAKLRLEAGTATHPEELAEAAHIERTASLAAIEAEITTLNGVKTAALRKTTNRNPSLVPRMAGGQRSIPSLQSTAATTTIAGSGSSVDSAMDDSIFLG
jgi:hypothetical protein